MNDDYFWHWFRVIGIWFLSLIIVYLGHIGAGTFLIDTFMLTILGYWNTRAIFKPNGLITKARPKKFFRSFFPLLYPLSILSLWGPGALAYWDIISATDAYFGLLPASVIGTTNGNDFMWNGFLLPLLGKEIVPPDLIPTYATPKHFLGLTILDWWGIIIWLSMPITLGWAILVGQAHAYLLDDPKTGRKFRKHRATLDMVLKGLVLNIFVIGLTLIIVYVICK